MMPRSKMEMVKILRLVLNSYGKKGCDLKHLLKDIKAVLKTKLRAYSNDIKVVSVEEILVPTITNGVWQCFIQATVALNGKGYRLKCDWGYIDDR